MKRLAIAFLIAFAPAAEAQPRACGMYGQMSEILRQSHGEGHYASGDVGTGVRVEIFANEETGSWTILVAMQNGGACAAASGFGFSTDAVALASLPATAHHRTAGERNDR